MDGVESIVYRVGAAASGGVAAMHRPSCPGANGIPLPGPLTKRMLRAVYPAADTMGLVDVSGNTSCTSCHMVRDDVSSNATETWESETSGWSHTVEESCVVYRCYGLVDRRCHAATLGSHTGHEWFENAEGSIYIHRPSNSYTGSHSAYWNALGISNYNSNASPLSLPRQPVEMHKSPDPIHAGCAGKIVGVVGAVERDRNTTPVVHTKHPTTAPAKWAPPIRYIYLRKNERVIV